MNNDDKLKQIVENAIEKYSLEYNKLHKSNKKHLDSGRYLGLNNKMRSAFNRLDLLQINPETGKPFLLNQINYINQIHKKDIWNEQIIHLQDIGYSSFGAFFYKAVRDSISVTPVSDLESHLKLHNNHLINNEMMKMIYLWGNLQIKSAFSTTVVENELDALIVLSKIYQNGVYITNNEFHYDGNTNQILNNDSKEILYSEEDMLYVQSLKDIDHLLDSILPNQADFNPNALKDFMLISFPEYKENLEKYPNFHFNQLLSIQMGSRFRNLLKFRVVEVILNSQKKNELHGWNLFKNSSDKLVENKNHNNFNQAVNFLNDVLTNILPVKLKFKGSNHNIAIERQSPILTNKNLKNKDRVGYNWNQYRNVSIQDLFNQYNISGIVWGASVNKVNERQEWLNILSESFQDLAYALKINPKDIGLVKKNKIKKEEFGIGISIGASSMKARAKYQKLNHKLVLTRKSGLGTLAHEWFHAYDSFLMQKALEKNVIPQYYLQYSDIDISSYSHFLSVMFKNKSKRLSEEEDKKLQQFDPYFYNLMEKLSNPQEIVLNQSQENNLNIPNAIQYQSDEALNYINDKSNYESIKSNEAFQQIFYNLLINMKTEQKVIEKWVIDEKIFNLSVEDFSNNIKKMYKKSERLLCLHDFSNFFYVVNSICHKNEELFKLDNFDIDDIDKLHSLIMYNPDLKEDDNDNHLRVKIIEALTNYFTEQQKIFDNAEDLFSNINNLYQNLCQKNMNDIMNNDSNKNTFVKEILNLAQEQVKLDSVNNNLENLINSNKIKQHILNNSSFNDIINKTIENNFNQFEKNANVDEQYSFFKPLFKKVCVSFSEDIVINLKNNFKNDLNQMVDKILFENGYNISIGKNISTFVKESKILDSGSSKPYWSSPVELLARAGEMSVLFLLEKENMYNSFLVDVDSLNRTHHYYPVGKELSEFSQLIAKSCQHNLHKNVLNIENIPIIENEYHFTEKQDVSYKNSVEDEKLSLDKNTQNTQTKPFALLR